MQKILKLVPCCLLSCLLRCSTSRVSTCICVNSEDLRRWFIQQEVDLFRFRFSQEREESILNFLQVNNLNYTPVSDIALTYASCFILDLYAIVSTNIYMLVWLCVFIS